MTKEWIERGAHDLEAAKLLMDRNAHADVVLFHIHQAVEKYLKGYLIDHGWELKKIHDLETLLTEASDFNQQFEEYLDIGRNLTAYYYTERYPPGPLPEYSDLETQQMLDRAQEIIAQILSGLSP